MVHKRSGVLIGLLNPLTSKASSSPGFSTDGPPRRIEHEMGFNRGQHPYSRIVRCAVSGHTGPPLGNLEPLVKEMVCTSAIGLSGPRSLTLGQKVWSTIKTGGTAGSPSGVLRDAVNTDASSTISGSPPVDSSESLPEPGGPPRPCDLLQCGFHRGNHVLTAIDQHIDDGNVGNQCSDTAGRVIGSSITIGGTRTQMGFPGWTVMAFHQPHQNRILHRQTTGTDQGRVGIPGILRNATKDGVSGIFG